MNTGRPASILLVDDDEVDVMAVRRAFATRAPRIRLARDGREALAVLRGQGVPPIAKPFLILLDLNLPRMSGLEFLRELRADPEHRSAVVFVLTTSHRDEDKVAAYGQGIAGYVVKSRAGQDLSGVVSLIDCYQSTVELP